MQWLSDDLYGTFFTRIQPTSFIVIPREGGGELFRQFMCRSPCSSIRAAASAAAAAAGVGSRRRRNRESFFVLSGGRGRATQ